MQILTRNRTCRYIPQTGVLTICCRNITERDIDAQLMTSRAGCPPLDILLRTGGDKRLSDFLLWQACVPTPLLSVPSPDLFPELR